MGAGAQALIGETKGVSSAPLCIDLDGSLLATDLLHESLLWALKKAPWLLGACVFWLLRGRSHLKEQLASRVVLDVARLPYRKEVVDFLRGEHSRGRPLVLATASPMRLARQVADHIGIFDEVIATTAQRNLKGQTKAAELAQRYGRGGFDYLGDDAADLSVWEQAANAYVVNRSTRVTEKLQRQGRVKRVFGVDSAAQRLAAGVKALRPHQWAKNLLLLVPLIAMHRVHDPLLLRAALTAFIAFCLVASATYVVNDLLDIEADRAHPRKSKRPFASGELSILQGMALAVILMAAGAALAASLPIEFQASLTAYVSVTVAYSLRLKRMAAVDVVCLAALYTLRIIAGGFAVSAPVSFWLLAFAMFLFFSLAMVKRYAELVSLGSDTDGHAPGRAYVHIDALVVLAMGTASGVMSIFVLALYINGDTVKVLYAQPDVLWLLCPLLLYWISRIWLLVARGRIHDDPVLFAVGDLTSYAVGAAGFLVIWLAM
jgi:4-hydroxybenzoate polyprenyltransferase